MTSPYPWHYTLRWPLYYLRPSIRNRTAMSVVPDSEHYQPSETETVKLLFCGDIMVQNQDRIPTLHPELCQLIQSSDFFIGNCEAPVGNHPLNHHSKYGFEFHMPRQYLEGIMQQTGLPAAQWVLSTANNHSGDKGYAAYLENCDILNEIGVNVLGKFVKDAPPLKIIECRGLRIGVIAWTEWMNCEVFPENNPGVYRGEHIHKINWRNIKREFRLDYLVGMPHWEYEFQHFPHQQTRTQARSLIDDAGINLLVGIHTHTVQPIEKFQHGLCAYNLGNLCGYARAWPVRLVALLEVNLSLAYNTVNRVAGYRMHYFYQQTTAEGLHIIPLDQAPVAVRGKIRHRLQKLFHEARPEADKQSYPDK
jgi:hypothetical protein